MKLYNTLSRTTEDFSPQNERAVSLYTCGPTVYDYQHIGNYIAYVRWDILFRTLKSNGYNVNWYMNITDVGHLVSDGDEGQDKLEKGASREGKTAWEVADFYLKDFLDGIDSLGLMIPKNNFVRATDYIDQQIELIKTLESKGHTYIIDDGVYFDSTTFPNYGKMARLDIEGLQSGARVTAGNKKNPTDFALWKLTPSGVTRDMEWESPWGKGFPGWHIECSALAMKFLGETIDIHAGGIDHIPVHHTNEIAQSEAATGQQFVKTWVHGNFLQVDGQKISKSLGNGYTLNDLNKKGYSPDDYRMFVLQSHYRTEAHFSWETLESAKNRLKGYEAMADCAWQPVPSGEVSEIVIENTQNQIRAALNNDLSTPLALSELNALANAIDRGGINTLCQEKYRSFLQWLDDAIGLHLSDRPDISTEQKELLSERKGARVAQNWQLSDTLRDSLAKQGIGVNDTPDRQVWYRL